MEFRAALQAERDEVLDLLALWYGDREFFARYNQSDPTFRDDLCLVAVDGRRIVSTVQIFDRKINLAGQTVPMGGIGSVFTREEYRHRGLASSLMRLAVDTMKREEFEISLLFAERLTFYNQFGWREIERSLTVLANASALEAPADFEIDVLDPGLDLPDVMRIHRDYSGRFNATAIRDHADWRGNLIYAGNSPAEQNPGECEEYFIIARRNGAIVAYARATRFHGIAMVMEFGCASGEEHGIVGLFKHMSQMGSTGVSSFRLISDHRSSQVLRPYGLASGSGLLVTHTRHDTKLEQLLAKAGAPPHHHPDNNYMWRIVSPKKLGKRFGLGAQEAERRVYEMLSDPQSLFWTADRF